MGRGKLASLMKNKFISINSKTKQQGDLQNLKMLNLLRKDSLYTKEELNELKMDMEVEVGSKLSKITYAPKIKIVCKARPNECRFEYVFAPVDSQHYSLESYQPNHLSECYFDPQTKDLYAQMLKLIRSRYLIENILQSRFDEGSLLKLQPKKLLGSIAFKAKEENFDLYGSIKNHESRKKLKKKFDNIVNEIKFKLLNKKKMNKQGSYEVGNHCPTINGDCNKIVPIPQIQVIPHKRSFTPVLIRPESNNQSIISPLKIDDRNKISDKNIFNSPAKMNLSINQSTVAPKENQRSNFYVSMFYYDPSPQRLFDCSQLKNILDSSPRMFMDDFEISQSQGAN